MNENTRKILDDLKKAGLDTTGIENQLQYNPIADRAVDNVLGAGVLRQADYTRYMNETQRKEKELAEKMQQLAILHDAAKTTELSQKALDTITALEETLIETGLFTEDKVKELSNTGKEPLSNLISALQKTPTVNDENGNRGNQPAVRTDMSNKDFDPSQYVDVNTFQTAAANLVAGNAIVNAKVTAAMRRAERLGVEVTDEMLNSFHTNLMDGTARGKNIDQIIDETFQISAAQKKADEDAFSKKLADAEAKGRAEALKEVGIQPRSRFDQRRHPILDRKSINQNVATSSEGNDKVDGKDTKPTDNTNLPTNKYGDVEVFKLRRGREERLRSAIELNDKVQEQLANDLTYVE